MSCDTDEVRQRNKVRIKTNISKRDVISVDEYPSDRELQHVYKYCCPICLRYFNNMLVSSCCANYICRFCIGDMAKKAKRDRSFVIKCAHCFETDFKLLDVKPDEKVKLYTDTPYKLGVFTPGGNSNRDSSEQQKDLTPCKFQGNDESTAFKSHMINSSNGKLMNSLDKYEDPQIALRKESLVQVEEEKHESEQSR